MIFLETFLVNLIKSQRIFAIICYYLKYLVSKFRILVHKRTILAWKLIFCSTLSTFRPKCPKTNGYNQTKNKLSLIIYFGNPKFWKCLGYSYDWLSIPPLDENLLFRTFVHCLNIHKYAFEFWQIFDWFWRFFRVNNVHIKSEKLFWTSHLKENRILDFWHLKVSQRNKFLKIEASHRHW